MVNHKCFKSQSDPGGQENRGKYEKAFADDKKDVSYGIIFFENTKHKKCLK
jgi:hypothetical protein